MVALRGETPAIPGQFKCRGLAAGIGAHTRGEARNGGSHRLALKQYEGAEAGKAVGASTAHYASLL